MDSPLRGLDDLAPLCGILGLYLLFLIVLRLFVWPFLVALRKRNTLGKLLGGLLGLLLALLFWGGLLVLLFSSLLGLGFGETLTELFYRLTDFDMGDLPNLADLGTAGVVVICAGLLLLLIIFFFLIRPLFSFILARFR